MPALLGLTPTSPVHHPLQAERWGARLETEDVVSVDLSTRPFTVRGTDTTVKALSVIVATVRRRRRLAEGEWKVVC